MPPKRRPLTHLRVLQAALELVDESGLQSLSMRALGAKLGVQAMSLYEHVRDKEALLDGLVELLVAEIDVPDPEMADWAEVLRGSARSYRAVAQRHPGAFVVMLTRPLATADALARLENALNAVRRSGFSARSALIAFTTIEAYTSGMAMNEVSGATALDVSANIAREFPQVSELAAVAAQAGADDMFEAGLDVVIAGLGALRS